MKIQVTLDLGPFGIVTKLLDSPIMPIAIAGNFTGTVIKAELVGHETISNVDDVPGHHQTRRGKEDPGRIDKSTLVAIHSEALASFPDVKRVQIRRDKDKATTVPSYPVSTSDMLILNDAFRGKVADEHGRILLTVKGRRFRQELVGDKLLFFAVAGGDMEDMSTDSAWERDIDLMALHSQIGALKDSRATTIELFRKMIEMPSSAPNMAITETAWKQLEEAMEEHSARTYKPGDIRRVIEEINIQGARFSKNLKTGHWMALF